MRYEGILATLSAVGLGLAGCASDLEDPTQMPPPDTGEEQIAHTANDDGTTTSVVDASDIERWIFLDLETRTQVDTTTAAATSDWDIAFRRFRVITNGGVNGPGGVEVARLGVVGFDAVSEAPADGYITDAEDSEDDGEIADDAIRVGPSSETGPWAYNIDTHELSNSGEVFVVKSVEGNYFKLIFEEYYDDAGSPGYVQMRWIQLTETLEPGVKLVSWDQGYTYLSIENGVISVDEPESSLDWDIALRLVGWQTNSGTTRSGLAGAQLADGNDFDAITTAPTTGFFTDRSILYPGPPGSPMFEGNEILSDWFSYDMTTHEATPRDVVFLVRGAEGSYGKLQVVGYDEPNKSYKLKVEPVDRAVSTHTETIDASDDTVWTYFSLRRPTEIPAEEAEGTLDWDLAFSGNRIRTNSGTSGDGEAGVAAPTTDLLADIAEAEAAGYAPDEMLTDPGDASMYSGSPILSEWWTTDGASEVVPKDQRYVLRAADGTYVKLEITGYDAGVYTIAWSYAGVGHRTF